MIIKVRTKIEFEVEYPLNTDFYGTHDEITAIGIESEYVHENPTLIGELFADEGKFVTSLNKVEE